MLFAELSQQLTAKAKLPNAEVTSATWKGILASASEAAGTDGPGKGLRPLEYGEQWHHCKGSKPFWRGCVAECS